MSIVENLQVTGITRTGRLWEVAVTATVAGVHYVGMYEVGADDIHERWFEPAGPTSSLTEDADEDYYVITDGTTTARISNDDYAAASKSARQLVNDTIRDLENDINQATEHLIAQKVA